MSLTAWLVPVPWGLVSVVAYVVGAAGDIPFQLFVGDLLNLY